MSTTIPPPATVCQVAQNVQRGADYTAMLKELGDAVIRAALAGGMRAGDAVAPISPIVYRDMPPLLANDIHRVHLAGYAEHLAHLSGQVSPVWAEAPEFFFTEPVYLGGPHSRERLLVEAPAAFRRRLLFCGPPLQKLFAILARQPV